MNKFPLFLNLIILSLITGMNCVGSVAGNECILSDGSTLEIRKEMRGREVYRYDLVRTSPEGEVGTLWQSHLYPRRGNGRQLTVPREISLSTIFSYYEDEEGVSVISSCIESDAMVFHLPKNAGLATPIRISNLYSRLVAPGHFELRNHRTLAFVVEDMATRQLEEKGIMRFDGSGKITEDFRPPPKVIYSGSTSFKRGDLEKGNESTPRKPAGVPAPLKSGRTEEDTGSHFPLGYLGVGVLIGATFWIIRRLRRSTR